MKNQFLSRRAVLLIELLILGALIAWIAMLLFYEIAPDRYKQMTNYLQSCLRIDDSPTLSRKVRANLNMSLLDLERSLALTPVVTGEEPFTLTYALPLTVDAASFSYYPDGFGKYRMLFLKDNGAEVNGYEINRETNGTYLVKWNTLFSAYGAHILQIEFLFPTHSSYDNAHVYGSKIETTVTNLLQWDYEITGFGRWSDFQAKLQVPSADYSLFIYNTNHSLIKRIDGHTESGSIFERWDTPPTNKYAWTDEDLKAEIAITPTTKEANGQIKSNAPTVRFPYPGR